MIKILMLQEINFTLDNGEASKLKKGKVYEAIQESTYFLVPVEGRRKEVYVPKDFARIVEEAGKGGVQIPIKGLQHFSPERPESDHYHTGSIDVWKFADENFSEEEVRGFHRIDAIKYLTRYGKKNGFNRKDLEKAIAEINKLLEIHDKGEWK